MRICDCKKHLEFDHVEDELYPYGCIESYAVYKCSVCGREFSEKNYLDFIKASLHEKKERAFAFKI